MVRSRFKALASSGATESLVKNSWKAMRPTRATESRLVSAKAEMDRVIRAVSYTHLDVYKRQV